MGEKMNMQMKELKPGQQIHVDLKNAVQKSCECGGQYFQQVFMAYTIPPLMSPTGQELTVQQPALMCIECGAALK
jgi:hypothetical protein